MSVCTASKMQFAFVTAVAKDMRIRLHDLKLKLRFVICERQVFSRALGFIAVNWVSGVFWLLAFARALSSGG